MLPRHHRSALGDEFPLQYQYLQPWRAPNNPPGITYQQNSLSPSTSSPVTPQSTGGPETVPYNRTQSCHNVVGSYATPGFDIARRRYRTTVDFDFPATSSSHEVSFYTGHSSICTDLQPAHGHHYATLQSRGFLKPQEYGNAGAHVHTQLNTSHRFLDGNEPDFYSNQDANGWTPTGGINSKPYGKQLVDRGDSPMQPLPEDTTQQIPMELHSLYVDDSSCGDQLFNVGGFASPVDSRVLSIECKHCQKAFTGKFRLGNRKRHIKNMHDPSKPEFPFVCQLCPHKYKRDDALLKHRRGKHPVEYPEAKPKGRNARALTMYG